LLYFDTPSLLAASIQTSFHFEHAFFHSEMQKKIEFSFAFRSLIRIFAGKKGKE